MLCIQKPIRADDFVTAQKKREILTGGIIALLIVCAVAARVITRGHRDAVYFLPVSLLRSFIYIGLTTWWGVSLWQRIVQAQVRRYLAATAALCVFWLSIRTVKFFFAATPAAIRYLWYGYYFPMLFLPLLCVFVALSLGKPENYRLPKWTSFLYIPTALLLLLVLTNDLHQLVFVFPADAAAWLDTDHGYGAGYFAVMGYIALGMVTVIVTMLLKCRTPTYKDHAGAAICAGRAGGAVFRALYQPDPLNRTAGRRHDRRAVFAPCRRDRELHPLRAHPVEHRRYSESGKRAESAKTEAGRTDAAL